MTDPTATALSFLLGSFAGVEQMHASAWAPAGSAASTIDGSAELNGSLVVQRYVQHRADAVSFQSLAVWMTDPATGEILYYGFDTAGFPADPPARGCWQGQDLVLDRRSPRGSSRLVVRPTAEGWAWAKAFRAPGPEDWTPVHDAIFRPVHPADRS